MINFRNTNIFFIILLMILIAVNVFQPLPVLVYIALLMLYLSIIFYGCYFISSGFFIPVLCSAHTDRKHISISFDDGPSSAYTAAILQILKEKNAKAAFFCIGNRIPGNELLVKRLHEEGHIIGNHSYSHHFWFDFYSSHKMIKDLQLTDVLIRDILGKKPVLFRPPYGVINPNVKKAIITGGYTPVGWSVRSMDTVIVNEKKLLGRITASLEPGAVFLFHDTSRAMLAVLPEFIEHVRREGYEIIRLDKMLNLQAYV